MIGAASSAVSFPSATSRRTVASSSPIERPPVAAQPTGRLVDVDLAALERRRISSCVVLLGAGGAGSAGGRGRRRGSGFGSRRRGRRIATSPGHRVEDDLADRRRRRSPAADPGAPRADGRRSLLTSVERPRISKVAPPTSADAQVAADRVDPVLLAHGQLSLHSMSPDTVLARRPRMTGATTLRSPETRVGIDRDGLVGAHGHVTRDAVHARRPAEPWSAAGRPTRSAYRCSPSSPSTFTSAETPAKLSSACSADVGREVVVHDRVREQTRSTRPPSGELPSGSATRR